jgi:hypothetical protein
MSAAPSADGTGCVSLNYRAAALPWLDTDNLADRTRTFACCSARSTAPPLRVVRVPQSGRCE